MRTTLEELQSLVQSQAPLAGAHPGLQDEILRFVGNLLDGRAAGAR